MPAPLIPIVIAGANVVARVAPLVAKRLIARGVAKKATQKQINKQITNAKKPVQRISEKRAEELASAARPKVGVKSSGKKLPRGGRGVAATVAAGTAAGIGAIKKSKKGKQPLIEAGQVKSRPEAIPLIQDKKQDKKRVDESKTEPKLDGSEYAPYPGAAGRAGFEYGRDIGEVLADKTVSPEIKERLEEEIIYEGDYKGGRVGKGKKMKMKKGGSPKGCGKARRGYGKAMMGGGMVKTKRGYGKAMMGGGMVKTKRGYGGGGRLY